LFVFNTLCLKLLAALLLVIGGCGIALAHHGWSWAEDVNSELTGVIVAAKLGNPHGVLTLEVKGERWVVEVGQPWRNERAGLQDAMLVKGVALKVEGHRERDPKKKVFKAERVIINGKLFNLYPDRN
jgi:Family of unknown function (DUF6152)